MRRTGVAGVIAQASFGAVATAGCSASFEPVPVPKVELSASQPDSNAAAVARLVKTVCIDSIDNPKELVSALGTSGWASAPSAMPAFGPGNRAELPMLHGKIIYSASPPNPAKGLERSCAIVLDAAVSPNVAPVIEALKTNRDLPDMAGTEGEIGTSIFRWKAAPGRERLITLLYLDPRDEDHVSTPEEGGLTIRVEHTLEPFSIPGRN